MNDALRFGFNEVVMLLFRQCLPLKEIRQREAEAPDCANRQEVSTTKSVSLAQHDYVSIVA